MTIGNKQENKQGRLAVKGFTLIETIVALSVSLIVVLGMSNVFLVGVQHIQAVKTDTVLTTNVAYVIQVLSHEIHKAKEITLIGPTQATIHHHDGSTVDLSLNGSLVMLGGSQITTSDISVTTLTLAKIGESLQLIFTFEAGTSVKRMFNGQTTFTPRK